MVNNTESKFDDKKLNTSSTLDMDADSGENISHIGGASRSSTSSGGSKSPGLGSTQGSNMSGTSSSDKLDSSDASSNVEHLRERASDYASDFSERARGYYDDASVWMRENSSTIWMAVGGLVTVGLAGYFISKRFSGRSEVESDRDYSSAAV